VGGTVEGRVFRRLTNALVSLNRPVNRALD
jgi:hypothetical protein